MKKYVGNLEDLFANLNERRKFWFLREKNDRIYWGTKFPEQVLVRVRAQNA